MFLKYCADFSVGKTAFLLLVIVKRKTSAVIQILPESISVNNLML